MLTFGQAKVRKKNNQLYEENKTRKLKRKGRGKRDKGEKKCGERKGEESGGKKVGSDRGEKKRGNKKKEGARKEKGRRGKAKGENKHKIPSEQTVQTVSLLLYNPFFVINRFCIRKITVNFHLQTGQLS